LAGVIAVALARRIGGGGFDVATAARLLGIVAVAVTAGTLFEIAALRNLLAPLLRHIGSRHALPAAHMRAPLGLRAKVIGLGLGVAAIATGVLALWAFAPGGPNLAATGASSAAGAWPAMAALVTGLAIAIALLLLAAGEIVAPMRALEARSEELARGELARPVAPAGEADEIGRLTVAFEDMRRSLRDRLRSTESINVDLEREVRRRTEALELKNAELRDALEKLRRAQDNLIRSEKLASMGRLVAGIAHEINNPINAVINSLGPLEDVVRRIAESERSGGDGTAAAVTSGIEMLAVIQRGAARAMAIVQALHNYSRGDESVAREVDLGRSIEDTMDLLRHRLRGLTVTKHADPEARVRGFAGQIDQAIMNLVINAAQAIGSGGSGGTIRVEARAQGDTVTVSVRDDGPGIPREVMPRIFDPFFTTKPVGEGSGLGLAIVHGIVERHGGTIDVDSAAGMGTTFTLRLPRSGGADAALSPRPDRLERGSRTAESGHGVPVDRR
jgi:signal transduction histidine kinase